MSPAPRGVKRKLAVLGGDPRFTDPVYVARPSIPDETSLLASLAEVLRSRWLTNDGAMVQRLEDLLRLRLGVPFSLAFCNATTGLMAALRALDLEGEVITTPFTFPATVQAIEWLGLTPVFCDVDPHSFNLDPAQADALVGPRTSALLPVHLYGNPCDVQAIADLAARRNLAVVYDAAHAFGVRSRGRPIGCWGDLSVFSFHATKVFHTAEGGAVVAPSERLRLRLRSLRNFGFVEEGVIGGPGLNGKMSELHAAVGLAVLEGFDDEIRRRGEATARYRTRLEEIEGLVFPAVAPDTVSNYTYLALSIDEECFGLGRDAVYEALLAENVVSRKYFYPLCSDNLLCRHLPSAAPERLPVARSLAARALCLPLHGELDLDQVDAIVDILLDIRDAAPVLRRHLAR